MEKELRSWKKVNESDLKDLIREIRPMIQVPGLVILTGEVGAGKTTFTKFFCDRDETFSPTYSVLTETYNLLHADFYRLKGPEEITHLELDLYLENKDYIFIEWGKLYLKSILRILPDNFSVYELIIKQNENNLRDYTLFSILP